MAGLRQRLRRFAVEAGGGAELHDEFRAGGEVSFGADGALVFLHDFGGDGEAEAGAALLGGEVGEEEALAHLVGEAGAGVGDAELDHAGVGSRRVEMWSSRSRRVLHGFGGVVDEVGEGALEGFGVGEDEREVGREVADDADVAEAAGEERERVFDDGVEVGGAGRAVGNSASAENWSTSERMVSTEEVMTSELRWMTAGELESTLCSASRGVEAVDVAVDLFGVERDGREGVLDLVGDAAGDFFPGALLLRAEEFGDVFEDEDVAEMFAGGGCRVLSSRATVAERWSGPALRGASASRRRRSPCGGERRRRRSSDLGDLGGEDVGDAACRRSASGRRGRASRRRRGWRGRCGGRRRA